MLKKTKIIIVATFAFALVACGGNGYDWQSGSFGGKSTLTSKSDIYSDRKTEIETGTGDFTFDALGFFTMSDETPLPGCHLQVSPSEDEGKFQLTELDRAYKGYSQDMQGCLGKIGKASTRVDITNGWIMRDKNGDTTLTLTFKVRDMPNEPLFEYVLKARKTSWF